MYLQFYRWFCHVDDDNYVNMPALTRFLQGYSHTEDWYLGRPSISHPIEVLDRANPGVSLTELHLQHICTEIVTNIVREKKPQNNPKYMCSESNVESYGKLKKKDGTIMLPYYIKTPKNVNSFFIHEIATVSCSQGFLLFVSLSACGVKRGEWGINLVYSIV